MKRDGGTAAGFLPRGFFIGLALALLAMTLAWHVPMMLWDHLDLLPIYQSWQTQGIAGARLFDVHDGSHLHALAYAVLLATTVLSHGQPWLDCVVSFALLVSYAWLVMRMAGATQSQAGRWGILGLVFLALYPGHLANLQWGWQVAVFLCLSGVAICVYCLSVGDLSWMRNAAALLAAVAACLSFATGVALIPVALVLLALRRELPWASRLRHALPWLGMAAFVTWKYAAEGAGAGAQAGVATSLLYALNFLGGGVLRFATDLAPWLVLAALAVLVAVLPVIGTRREALPWLGLLLFGAGSAVLTALGRAGVFGADHAFATRYASFSSVFWLGWWGLLLLALHAGSGRSRKWLNAFAAMVMVFCVANSVHLAKKAARVGSEARETVRAIRATYPDVDEAHLAEMYFGRTDLARQRLQALRAYGFAPFDSAGSASRSPAPEQTPR